MNHEARALCWLDEDRLAFAHADGLVSLACTGAVSSPIPGAPAGVCCLAVGSGGALLAGSDDGTVVRWARLDSPPVSFRAHAHAVLAIHERADQTVITVAMDGVRSWSLDGRLLEQLNTIGKSVLLRVRPDSEWPIALESLRGSWAHGIRGEITDPELNRWIGAFVRHARRQADPHAPLIRVPISAFPTGSWRWGASESHRSGRR